MISYYFQPLTRRMAIFCALPGTVCALFFLELYQALLAGAAFALLMSFVFPLLLWIQDRKYRRLEKALPEKILFRERILLRLPNDRAATGCLYLYRGGVILCALRKRLPAMVSTVPKRCLWQVQLQEHVGQIRLCFYDDMFCEFYCYREEELLNHFRKEGWNVSDPPRG